MYVASSIFSMGLKLYGNDKLNNVVISFDVKCLTI